MGKRIAKHIPSKGKIAKLAHMDMWYETFGNKKNPPLLLVMGGLCQGILWPTEFCKRLAKAGFYVIRYDHRDTGYSTSFNYEENPYDLFAMAKDAMALMEHLKLKNVHVMGMSMGGPISEFVSLNFKGISSLTLMATSCDLRPSSVAYEGVYPEDSTLSEPKDIYLEWMQRFLTTSPTSDQDKLERRVKCWEVLNGGKAPFDKELYTQIHQEYLDRMQLPDRASNHVLAIRKSFIDILELPFQISVPTLIIQGGEDPVFPTDHGEAMARAIKGSKYLLIPEMGHVMHANFYDKIIEALLKLAKS